jgi:putative nucleotidyltransferase with HDIG domain
MRHGLALSVGFAAGVLLYRERRARRSAERLAAATLETLLNAIDANDPQTGRHVRRVAAYALIIADEVELSRRECNAVERAALFHDIGKIHEALFDITHEPKRLTPAERRAIDTHPHRGAEVLAPLAVFYPELAETVLSHHERWDGRGYPRRLRGANIPFAARIVTLADTFDAVAHSRRYRKGAGVEAAERVILAGRGTQFDPTLVDLMLLPPVRERLEAEHLAAWNRPEKSERRDARPPASRPEITFRWRQRSHGDTSPSAAQPHGGGEDAGNRATP